MYFFIIFQKSDSLYDQIGRTGTLFSLLVDISNVCMSHGEKHNGGLRVG